MKLLKRGGGRQRKETYNGCHINKHLEVGGLGGRKANKKVERGEELR